MLQIKVANEVNEDERGQIISPKSYSKELGETTTTAGNAPVLVTHVWLEDL